MLSKLLFIDYAFYRAAVSSDKNILNITHHTAFFLFS